MIKLKIIRKNGIIETEQINDFYYLDEIIKGLEGFTYTDATVNVTITETDTEGNWSERVERLATKRKESILQETREE